MVLIVCAPLNRCVHQRANLATRGLHGLRKLWRRTRPCRRWTLTVSLLCCVVLCLGRGVDCGFMMLWAVVGLCFWVEGRERGVDCVCPTEPPCSSESKFGHSGFASLAQALEKNTTLQRLSVNCEFVVLCLGRGVDCCLCCCGLLLVCVFGLRGVCVALIACAPLNRRVHQTHQMTRTHIPPLEALSVIFFRSIVRSDLSPRRALEPRSPPPSAVSSRRHV